MDVNGLNFTDMSYTGILTLSFVSMAPQPIHFLTEYSELNWQVDLQNSVMKHVDQHVCVILLAVQVLSLYR